VRRAAGLVALALLTAAHAAPVSAHVTDGSVQAANMQPMVDNQLDSPGAQQVFCDLSTTGFNTVTLVIPLFQAARKATTITPRAAGPGTAPTPSDAQLVTAIRNARQCGLKVVLKPHLELPGGEWRAHIKGGRRWQAAWNTWLVHYAKIGRAEGVDTLVIGNEQKGAVLPKGSSARWVKTVAAVRRANPLIKVTYAAHTNDEALLLPKKFVSKLDFLSLTYYPRPHTKSPSVAKLERSMRSDKTRYFDKIYRRYRGKHIVFAETGFRSIALKDYYAKGPQQVAQAVVDTDLQRMQYEALLHFLDGISYVDGVMLFRAHNPPTAGGPQDPSLTWQGKPAEAVIARYLGGTVPVRAGPATRARAAEPTR